MVSGEFDQALAAFDAAVDALQAADLGGLDAVALLRAVELFERGRRRLEAVDQRLLGEAQVSGVAAVCGQPSLVAVLAARLRVDAGEARRRVARALDCAPRRSLTGEPLEPVLPQLAGAVAAGEVSAAQVDVIITAMGRLPAGVAVSAWPVAEGLLVEASRHETPKQLRRTARLLLDRLDPDGAEPEAARQQRRRAFTLVKNGDGTSRPTGRLTAELTARLETVLDALAAPRPVDEQGTPDPRSAGQRRHDGLLEALARVLRSGTLPASGGVPVTILATTTMRELQARVGVAVTGHGDALSVRELLALAAEALIVPVVCDDAGGVLAYGRTQRLASAGQRLALAARDGGCCFPGCDRPAAWTQVHHVREWINGGRSDLDNLCLLCVYHHANFGRLGWVVVMTGGVPEWIPPAWLDPDRRPIRNTAHHLSEIEFRQPTAWVNPAVAGALVGDALVEARTVFRPGGPPA